MLWYQEKVRDLYVSRWRNIDYVPHLHRHYEMLVCTEGSLIATCCEKTQTLLPGDMMIAFSNNIHSFTSSESGAGILMSINPGILPLIMERQKGRIYDNFYLEQNLHCVQLAEAILNEYQTQRDPILLTGYFNILLGIALRHLPHRIETDRLDDELFPRIMSYVSENYNKKISLKTLSHEFGLDPCYLSRLFTAHIHTGFLDYVHGLRVERAKHLLQHTNLLISNIAFESGFADQKTFNRVFLKTVGETPRQYRKENG